MDEQQRQLATGPCDCCQRQNAILAPTKAPDDLPATSRICGICVRHLGQDRSSVKRREADHLDLWSEDTREQLEALAARHAASLGRLQQENVRLKQELADRPERIVVQNLDLQEVDAAHSSRDAAFRSRDTAYSTLSELRMAHHDVSDGQCRCGKPFDRCDVAMIVDRFPALRSWEEKQVEFMRRGMRHHLPDGHPAMLDRRRGAVSDALLDHAEDLADGQGAH